MSYSIELHQGNNQLFKTHPHYCREVTQGYFFNQFVQAMKNADLTKATVVFDLNFRIPKKYRTNMVNFTTLFTRRLLKKLAMEACVKQRMSIKITNVYRDGCVCFKISMPAFVLHNPYFISFYIGCLKVMAGFLNKRTTTSPEDISKLEGFKTYTAKLRYAQKYRNGDYPTNGDFTSKRKALFASYKKTEFLSDVLKKRSNIYGSVGYNGFNNWWEGEGKDLAPLTKKRSSR